MTPTDKDSLIQRGPGHPAGPAAEQPPTPQEDERAVSETERQAGTPDERATTDGTHGEGEPQIAPPPGAPNGR